MKSFSANCHILNTVRFECEAYSVGAIRLKITKIYHYRYYSHCNFSVFKDYYYYYLPLPVIIGVLFLVICVTLLWCLQVCFRVILVIFVIKTKKKIIIIRFMRTRVIILSWRIKKTKRNTNLSRLSEQK